MDKVSSLSIETNQVFAFLEFYFVEDHEHELLKAKLKEMKLMLSGALDQLEEMGGFGAFDKETAKSLKSGLDRVSLFVWETRAALDEGHKGCNFNTMHMCVSGVGRNNRNKNYLKKLAKDALDTLPLLTHPESQGRSFVREVGIAMFKRQMIAKEDVVMNLLMSHLEDSNVSPVSVVPILGMAGVGKTSLVRLALSDSRVRQHFDIKIWVNISEHLSSSKIIHEVASKLDALEYGRSISSSLLQTKLEGKKYLLILENLFEDDGGWFKLLEPLLSMSPNSKHGSKIIVTSRSISLKPHALHRVPMAIGAPYLLEPLDHNESLAFFFSIAFGETAEGFRDPHLREIGVKICNKCANNFLAIKIIASLLSSQPINRKSWQYFNDVLLASIKNPVESIQSIVDLMEDSNLRSPRFLSYTSLFPPDYNFLKTDLPLLDLLGPFGYKTSIDFNEYIDKLLAIGYFFENRVANTTGDIIHYQVNSLLCEVMNYLTKDEWCLLHKPLKNFDADIVEHASFIIHSSWQIPPWLHSAKHLKTLFFFPSEPSKFINIPNINEILRDMKALQALDLAMVQFNTNPDFLGELKRLRYLRLGNSLASFPECITNLNLVTLDLRHTAIKELPTNFSKLENLKFLYTGCRLIDLPPSFEEISDLQILDEFIVGKNNGLDQLAKLSNLSGKLNVRFQEGRKKHTLQVEEDCFVRWNLEDLSLTWSSMKDNNHGNNIQIEEDALEFEFLQPPANLERLSIKGWKGVRFPQWVTVYFSVYLKSLLSLQIIDCSICQQLPSFNSIPNLRSLRLQGLPSLEWVQIPNYQDILTTLYWAKKTFFPSLKYLMLANLPQLKEWSKVDNYEYVHKQETFKCLVELKVSHCPMMMSMPPVPNLEKLEVVNVHETLLKHLLSSLETPTSSSSTTSSKSSTLEELHIKSVHQLESLIITISCLQVLAIRECKDLAHVFVDPTNTLKRLQIQACLGIKHVSQIMHNLTVLEELEIDSCQEADPVTDDSTRVAWQDLKSLRLMTLINISRPQPLLKGLRYIETLKELYLCWLYNLTVLPESISHLTGLSRLVIRNCPKVKRIPEYFSNLKSLNRLEIKECWRLQKRCEQPDGEDCHLIQHILPGVYLSELPTPEGY